MKTLERGALRAALLVEVKAICADAGPEAVSIAKIAKKLGVSSGAPFRIFPSREHIFSTLIEEEMVRLDERFAQVTQETTGDNVNVLRQLCLSYLDHARTDPAMFRLSFSVSAKAMGAASLQAVGESIFAKVTQAVAACMGGSQSHDNIAQCTYIIWSTIHGHALLAMTGQVDDQDIEIDDATVVEVAIAQFL